MEVQFYMHTFKHLLLVWSCWILSASKTEKDWGKIRSTKGWLHEKQKEEALSFWSKSIVVSEKAIIYHGGSSHCHQGEVKKATEEASSRSTEDLGNAPSSEALRHTCKCTTHSSLFAFSILWRDNYQCISNTPTMQLLRSVCVSALSSFGRCDARICM